MPDAPRTITLTEKWGILHKVQLQPAASLSGFEFQRVFSTQEEQEVLLRCSCGWNMVVADASSLTNALDHLERDSGLPVHRVGIHTSIGSRQCNADSYACAVDDDTGMAAFAVADGIGQRPHAARAAAVAATAAVACALEAPDSYAVTGLMNARDILTEADLVYDGDTVMVLAVSRPTATGQDITWDLVWVGDCVAWLVNSTGVTRLTTPHTEGQQLHELGWPEFHASQHDNIVLTTVGTADRLPHGNATVTTGTGRLILASDGIGDLAKQQGLKSLCTDVVDPQACAQLLVERSTEHLHADNATAMVIDLVSRH